MVDAIAQETTARALIQAQAGAQDRFLRNSADIVVYGGAAGAGKSYALLIEPLFNITNPDFGSVIFRRTYPQIMNEGGLWDTSQKIYPQAGGVANKSRLEWTFPSGAKIKFGHMQREEDRYTWDGAQIPLICYDQLEHFPWRVFFYMLARNRSACGVKPYIRATCNPDPDHWLREFMGWWIDEETGFPKKERGGWARWFIIRENEVIWADTADELTAQYGKTTRPKSFTFIPGSVRDNRILLDNDPSYLSNLEALPKVDRARLLMGNWNERETAGSYFQRHWFEIVDAVPAGGWQMRYWDRASTEEADANPNSSHTAGGLYRRHTSGLWYIEDMIRFQGSWGAVETAVLNTAKQDGRNVPIGIEQDPGQAGKKDAEQLVRMLGAEGFIAYVNPVRDSKGIRAKAPSAQAEAGNIKMKRASWNSEFLREAVNFDGTRNCTSDQIDTLSGAYYLLSQVKSAGTWGRRR